MHLLINLSSIYSIFFPAGPKVLDEVLTPLLTGVSEGNEGSDVALDALRQLMAVKSHVVLPHVVPQLIKPPVNIRALAMLTAVAGKWAWHWGWVDGRGRVALWWHVSSRIWEGVVTCVEKMGGDEVGGRRKKTCFISHKISACPCLILGCKRRLGRRNCA